MNTELLLKVADHIEANPHSFDMEDWISHNKHCNTTACVAGTICILSGQADIEKVHIWSTAQRLLDIVPATINPRSNISNPRATPTDTELFLAGSMDWREDTDDGEYRCHDGPTVINNYYSEHVPAALRWMVANDHYNWHRAFDNLGILRSEHK